MRYKSLIAIMISMSLTLSNAGYVAVAAPADVDVQTEEAITEVLSSDAIENAVSDDAGESISDNGSNESKTDTGHPFVPGFISPSINTPAVDNSIDYNEARRELVSGAEDEYDSTYSEAKMGEAVPSAFPAPYTGNWLDILKEKYPATRNQGHFGTCWAHATMAMAEFDLINQGYPEEDLSELHLAYWSYTNGTPSIAGDTGDKVSFRPTMHTFKQVLNILDQGGNFDTSAQVLMRQRGASAEADVPYSLADAVAEGMALPKNTEKKDSAYLNNAYFINIKENPQQVKEAIKVHGAVAVSYYADPNDRYYDAEHNSYYSDGSDINHGVAVVGWDDDFPAPYFTKAANRPSRNGAWLVRNSWSTETDATYKSYFWMSYEEPSLDGAAVFEWCNEFPYDNNYYYDSEYHTLDGVSAWKYANVYELAGESPAQNLTAVGFEVYKAYRTGSNYIIQIYKNPENDDPASGELISAATTTGKILYRGRYTVPLKTPVSLRAGDRFSVVITSPEEDMEIAKEVGTGDGSLGASSVCGLQEGQSFRGYMKEYSNSDSGIQWQDASKDPLSSSPGNLIISALTTNAASEGDLSRFIVDKKTLRFTKRNERETITAKVWDNNGKRDMSSPVTFVVQDPSIASVKVTGQTATVTPLSDGNTTLKVTYSGETKEIPLSCQFTIEPVKINGESTEECTSNIYEAGTTLILSTEPTDAEIYYMLRQYDSENAQPDLNDITTLYTAPIKLTEDMIGIPYELYTYGKASGYTTSMIGKRGITVVKPSEDPSNHQKPYKHLYTDPLGSSIVNVGETITVISGRPSNPPIYYTLDESDPEINGVLYTEPIQITKDMAGKKIHLCLYVPETEEYIADKIDPGYAFYVNEYIENDKGTILSLNTTDMQLVNRGSSKQLKATAYTKDGALIPDAQIEFTSENPNVATVTPDGLVTAVGMGSTTITATCDGKKRVCTVNVTYSVKFYVRGELYKEYVSPPYGKPLPEFPENPEGAFLGWTDGYGNPWTETTPVIGEAKLYAVFEGEEAPSMHTVRFYVGKDLYKEYPYIGYNTTLTELPENPTGKGEFLYWVDENNKKWDPATPITRDLNLRAKFEGSSGGGGSTVSGAKSPLDPTVNTDLENIYLVKGQTFTVPVGYMSTNPRILAIAKNGKATAKAAGSAELRDTTGEHTSNVTVIEPVAGTKTVSLIPGEESEVSLIRMSGGNDLSAEYPAYWISANPSIADVAVTPTGARIIGVAKGSTTITAYVNGKAYKIKAKISDTRKVNLTGQTSSLALTPLQTVSLKLSGVNFKNAEWTSDRGMQADGSGNKKVFYDGIVHITAAGKLTAVGAGTTSLTCTTNGIHIDVTVGDPAVRNVYINTGKKQALSYYKVKNKDATWNCGTATEIDGSLFRSNGTIKGLSAGTVSADCFYDPYGAMGDGFTYKAMIHVENPSLEAADGLIRKSPLNYDLTMSAGGEHQLKLEDTAQYKVSQPVIFTSSKPQTAYVDENGMIHASKVTKRTTTTLTGTVNGKKLKIKLTVSP